jgi:hypothetical protein
MHTEDKIDQRSTRQFSMSCWQAAIGGSMRSSSTATAFKRDAGTKAYSPRGYDWSSRVPNIVSAAGKLVTHAAILEGEVIYPTEEGHPDFAGLEGVILKMPGVSACETDLAG